MSKEILIQFQKGERQVAITEGGRLDDFFIEAEHHKPLLGNIYKGRVESILPSINAAFVNIGQKKNGFLYLTDAASLETPEDAPAAKGFLEKLFEPPKDASKDVPKDHPKPPPRRRSRKRPGRFDKSESSLKVGQEVLVQVVKDPFSEKGARLTTHVSLPGRFVVYMPYDQQTGVSRKISNDDERKRLKEVIDSFTFAKTGGFIIRTASLKQNPQELVKDARNLYSWWLKILKRMEEVEAPYLIYEEGELIWRVARDYFRDDVSEVIADSEEDFAQIRKYVQTMIGRQWVSKIHMYKGAELLFESRHLTQQLKMIYEPSVPMKSGAYIVIQDTEGMSVIDVNSGRFKTQASPGDAAFMVNMEVAPEIARQLRLRDLGGIIVIDFIDMIKEEHKRKVIGLLQRELIKDPAKTEVNKISPLGLVEMTRARTGKNLESIAFAECPYCAGRGKVKVA